MSQLSWQGGQLLRYEYHWHTVIKSLLHTIHARVCDEQVCLLQYVQLWHMGLYDEVRRRIQGIGGSACRDNKATVIIGESIETLLQETSA